MAVANGYGKVIMSDSVFMYDTGDTINSYIGEPTVNRQWNNGTEFTPSYSSWTGAPAPVDVTGTSNQGPVKGAKTWKFTKNGNSNQWHGWEWTYGGIWTGNAGDIWTTSYWYKTTAPAGVYNFGVGYFYKDDWSAPYNTTILSNVSSIIADGQWHYNSTTVQFNENYTNAIIVDGPSWGYSDQAGELYINGLQWEKKPHATPFAYGTRSATQGLLPLVGNSTINLSNVSFDSNAQMYFDGTNDYIDVAYYSTVNNSLSRSWEVIVKPTANMSYAGIFGNKLGYGCSLYCNGGIFIWDGNWAFNWFDNSNYQFVYSYVAPTANQYFHIVGTYDANDQKPRIYVNGELKGTYGSSTNMNYGGATYVMDIGWNSKDGGQQYFQGQIPVTKYYQGKALSASEVQQNYNKYKSRFNLS